MKRFVLTAATVALLGVGAPAAHASTIIDFTLTGGDTGSLEMTETSGLITDITGTFDGSTILALLPVPSIGGNDNEYFGAPHYFDGPGVSFSLTSPDSHGFSDINLFSNQQGPLPPVGVLLSCQGNSPSIGVDCGSGLPGFQSNVADSLRIVSTVTTPEPASIVLLGTGLVATVSRFRRRRSPDQPS